MASHRSGQLEVEPRCFPARRRGPQLRLPPEPTSRLTAPDNRLAFSVPPTRPDADLRTCRCRARRSARPTSRWVDSASRVNAVGCANVRGCRPTACLHGPRRNLGSSPYPGGVELAVPDPPLSDGVVALRVPSEQDLPAIERRAVDPEVVRWMGPVEHTARELLELNRTRWSRGTRATFSVCDPSDACVGQVWVEVDLGTHIVGAWGTGSCPRPEERASPLGPSSWFPDGRSGSWGWPASPCRSSRRTTDTRGGKRSGFVKEGVGHTRISAAARVDCVVFSLVPATSAAAQGLSVARQTPG